jgi:hypothetical protein
MAWQDVVGALASGSPGPRERALEEELRLELEAHLAMRTEDNVAAGMEPAAARRDAEQRFGDVEAIARACLESWIGGRIMLHRIHLVVSIALALGVAWMIAQNRRLEAVSAEARMAAEERAQHLVYELRSKYEPEDELVFRVGDRVDMRGFGPDIVEVVQRDGKLLVPDLGWTKFAGRARSEVETELREEYLKRYGEEVPLNLVIVEDAAR